MRTELSAEEHERLLARRARIEDAPGPLTALAGHYRDGLVLSEHAHGRAQLLSVHSGVVIVSTPLGRWLVPPGHALWIPARLRHAVEMLGAVELRSIYFDVASARGPEGLAVLAMSELMRALTAVAVGANAGDDATDGERTRLATALILAELPSLEARPLALPLPENARLARLCRDYLDRPGGRVTIDGWARALGMSRRAFTRLFRHETGLGLSAWRQQAALLAALPRLSAGEAVTTVALDLGYSSVPAFTTMFKRMLGVAPSAYARAAAGRR